MSSSKKRYIHEGWIHKWTNFIGSWRPRYFMLEPDCLSYSIEKDGVVKESFLLSHCKIRLCPDDPVRLDIEVVGSCLLCLRTDTPLEKHKWYVSFKRAQKLSIHSNQKKQPGERFLSSAHQEETPRPTESETLPSTESGKQVIKKEFETVTNREEKPESISNIFVKSRTGRESKTSLSYILDNTETFEHISSKILNELETTTDSESLKHLKTFRLILSDFCCSIKRLSEEEFSTADTKQPYYESKSDKESYYLSKNLGLDGTKPLSVPVPNVHNLFSEPSNLDQNHFDTQQYVSEEKLAPKESQELHEESIADSDTSEELIDPNKGAKMLDYHEFTLGTGCHDPTPLLLAEKAESISENFSFESKVSDEDQTSDEKQQKSESKEQKSYETASTVSSMSKLTLKTFSDSDRAKIKRRNTLSKPRLDHKVSTLIRKDLSRIRMPIVFNEPTSNLQRAAEDFTYYKILNEAADMEDPIDRLANVTVYSITPYSSAVGRSYKPFNPLLGETYEISHTGFNYFAEQVAHHPPILAFHCFNDKFESSGSLNMVINFTGKAIEANLMGPFVVDLKLPSGVEKYNLQRCNMILHNLIFGKMWIEAVGYVIIRNVTGGDFSVMQYLKKGWFNKEIHKVRGLVLDKFGTQHYYISGIWSKHIFIEKVYSSSSKSKTKLLNDDGSLIFNKYRYKNEADAWDAFVNDIDWENINVIPNTRREVWKPFDRPSNNEDYYGFGYLTMQLNELTEDYDKSKGASMPKTDSRYRPDQRLYEEGRVEEATELKKRLEDKQRAVAKDRLDNHITYKPYWFMKVIDPVTHQANWGTYWSRKLDGTVDEGTPDIFGL
ncbi:oxysterol binding protein-related protein 1, putative [Theileria annulata]|uniref:Oxysterol binding protein-related protein 1, putative n=1 Tax=Theileria annulata TaxID=5874 RepID=Q4UEA5_THEAN|nr:oxysterol binding protein-related protein 1, putative [Theileria annulata]CAI74584.1 oxysterol binding protein-related protein 1, putative [Theileria annulata]|eukprot:XP_952316.1 oxysterol binding protein-related protein 1, putative [Theileria annulata]